MAAAAAGTERAAEAVAMQSGNETGIDEGAATAGATRTERIASDGMIAAGG
jgi:hypothetical protein